jgi:hypothetical protein
LGISQGLSLFIRSVYPLFIPLDRIWARYGLRIQELCARDHITRHDYSQPDLFAPDDDPPF